MSKFRKFLVLSLIPSKNNPTVLVSLIKQLKASHPKMNCAEEGHGSFEIYIPWDIEFPKIKDEVTINSDVHAEVSGGVSWDFSYGLNEAELMLECICPYEDVEEFKDFILEMAKINAQVTCTVTGKKRPLGEMI